jgi:hypothetical protein
MSIHWYEQHSETRHDGVKVELAITEEDVSVRGHFAGGDDVADAAMCDEIIRRADNGDVWAWCTVRVRCSVDGFQGEDYVGGCSYTDTRDFMGVGGYFSDMVDQAMVDLINTLKAEQETAKRAAATLERLSK